MRVGVYVFDTSDRVKAIEMLRGEDFQNALDEQKHKLIFVATDTGKGIRSEHILNTKDPHRKEKIGAYTAEIICPWDLIEKDGVRPYDRNKRRWKWRKTFVIFGGKDEIPVYVRVNDQLIFSPRSVKDMIEEMGHQASGLIPEEPLKEPRFFVVVHREK